MNEQDSQSPKNDPLVQELLPGYIKRREIEVAQLACLLDDKDFEKIRIIGHNLKGSGGMYGLPEVSDIGGVLETAAQANNSEGINIAIENLQKFIAEYQLQTP